MADLRQVTYCGLYCGLCAQCNRIPKRAAALRESMQKEGWDRWGKEIPRFVEFWEFLNWLVKSEARCSCRGGDCGPPFCGQKGNGVRLRRYPVLSIRDIGQVETFIGFCLHLPLFFFTILENPDAGSLAVERVGRRTGRSVAYDPVLGKGVSNALPQSGCPASLR